MAPRSLPTKGRSLSSTATVTKSTASTSTGPDSTLHSITSLSSRLPPTAPTHGDLNPLVDLITLFESLPLGAPLDASPRWLQTNRQAVHTSLHALKATFEALINHGRLHGVFKGKKAKTTNSSATTDKEMQSVLAVKQWLQQRWQDYLAQATRVVGQHWDIGVRTSALNALMSLLRTESAFLTSLHHSRQAQFPSTTFAHIVRAILVPQGDDGVLRPEIKEEWLKWWNRYDDVRFHFLKEAATLLSTNASSTSTPTAIRPPHLTSNLISLFESLTTMPTVPSELNEWWCSTPIVVKPGSKSNKKRKLDTSSTPGGDGSTGVFDSSSSESEQDENAPKKLSSKEAKKFLPPLLSLSTHRRVFQDAWLALLALPQDESEAKRVLSILHRQVLPHMTDAKRLMDWLVDCTTQGGTVAILALNGLFTLMQKHNLEYPNFYPTLYSLLTRSLLHMRYRPRFFRLLILFLSSTHVSASLIASFIKRLARLSLSAPPSAIVSIVPLVYNLLKLHPGCMVLLHRPSTTFNNDDESAILNDPYHSNEPDPNLTRALESSLWELASLRSHYLQSVSGLAKVFGEVMNKQSYDMEDFLDHSFATMFETEVTRIIRTAPALADVPKRQPIGDSFFPKMGGLVEKRSRKATDEDGQKIEEEVDEEPVDIVSKLWSF